MKKLYKGIMIDTSKQPEKIGEYCKKHNYMIHEGFIFGRCGVCIKEHLKSKEFDVDSACKIFEFKCLDYYKNYVINDNPGNWPNSEFSKKNLLKEIICDARFILWKERLFKKYKYDQSEFYIINSPTRHRFKDPLELGILEEIERIYNESRNEHLLNWIKKNVKIYILINILIPIITFLIGLLLCWTSLNG